MTNFFLSKNFAQPGDIVNIQGDCSVYPSTFASSDDQVAVVETNASGSTVSVVWIGEANIYETSLIQNCTNWWTGIVLTSTEDGKPFFMSKGDYITFTNYEWIFVFFLLLTAFIIRFSKKS